MAGFDINFPDDFLGGLLGTDFGEIAEEALEEAAPLLERAMKDSCRRVIDHPGESELVESIRSGKPKRTRTDAWIINVTPKGYSRTKMYREHRKGRKVKKRKVSNALKLIWKEYGIAGRQPARPFLANASNNARAGILEKLQEVYSRKAGQDGDT